MYSIVNNYFGQQEKNKSYKVEPRTVTIQTRITKKEAQKLDKLCKQHKRTRSSYLQILIQEAK